MSRHAPRDRGLLLSEKASDLLPHTSAAGADEPHPAVKIMGRLLARSIEVRPILHRDLLAELSRNHRVANPSVRILEAVELKLLCETRVGPHLAYVMPKRS